MECMSLIEEVNGRREMILSFMGSRRGRACSGVADFMALLSR